MNLQEATQLVRKELDKDLTSDPRVILDGKTIERDSCFIFFWTFQSALDSTELYAGIAPYLVDRKSGRVHPTSTAGYSIPRFIESFERFGNPRAISWKLPCTVTLTGGRRGAQTIRATQRLRDTGRFTLGPAKAAIDSVLAGSPLNLLSFSPEAAEKLAADLNKLGFDTRLSVTENSPV